VSAATETSLDEVADTSSSIFESASSSTSHTPAVLQRKAREESRPLSFGTGATEPYNSTFSVAELKIALFRTRDTFPGPDAIHDQMLRHLPPPTLVFLLQMYNRIWSEGSFPSKWGEAIVVRTLKAGKYRSLPCRPIHLTSCVCKLLERMLDSRLVWILESQGLLSNY
jgi:potassium voltage-gated channel Eag-related subfamily H protein 8